MKLRIPILLILAISSVVVAHERAQGSKGQQKKAGAWRELFDGKTLAGWRGFHRQEPAKGWAVENGMLKLTSMQRPPGSDIGGDLITVDQFENFEFEVEWRLSKGGNSGIKYLVSEDLPKTGRSAVSFEYQVLDDENHPDAKMGIAGNRTVGSLYDLIPAAASKKVNAVGAFNKTRIVKHGTHVEHWLNGIKLLEFDQGSPDLKAHIAASKFKTTAGFGEAKRGHFLLQDHNDEVWFKNIRVREF